MPPKDDARPETTTGADSEHLGGSSQELTAILRALPDLYFVLDGQRRFVDFSAGRDADLYRAPEAFLGRDVSAVLPPDVAQAINAAIVRAHAGDEVATHEYSLEMHGRSEWFEARLAPFGGDKTVALVRNVSDRRHAAEKLRLQEERVRQAEKLESLGRVAGSIAHDFNNILASVTLSCSVAERRLMPGHPAHEALLDARAALRRAGDLTRHLLAFARRDAVGADVLDLDFVIDEMEFILRGLASPPVMFARERSPVPLRVRAVRVQLEQVLLNLVVNAVDAMPAGGDLTLRTIVEPTEQQARLELCDTGGGMTKEVAARALEPFFSTKPEGEGTGLGLATVDDIVRAAGGRVAIESATGAGTTMTIRLPLADA